MQAVFDEIGYAPALRVGNTVYVSRQIGRDTNLQLAADPEAQIIQAF